MFFELHTANEYQDAEFINLMFPLGYEMVEQPLHSKVFGKPNVPIYQKKSKWMLFMDLMS